jgi:hypothetical protein
VADRLKTRVRVNLKRVSVKDGYRPDITIEVEWFGDDLNGENDEEGLYRLGSLIQAVEKEAFGKANEMNLREGFPLIPLDKARTEQTSTNGGTRFTERFDPDTGEIFDEE